jgi:hypothetical protein
MAGHLLTFQPALQARANGWDQRSWRMGKELSTDFESGLNGLYEFGPATIRPRDRSERMVVFYAQGRFLQFNLLLNAAPRP